MATYLSLEDAAKRLGIPTEKLIDLRSQGQVRGFRDGSSWKFPDTEIDRLKDEIGNLSGIGSGILASEDGGSKIGAVIGGDSALSIGDPLSDDGSGSDLELGLELPSSPDGSDVNLIASGVGENAEVTIVPEPKTDTPAGSDAPLAIDLDELNVGGSAISHDSGELNLSPDTPAGGSSSVGAPASLDDSDEFQLGSALDIGGDSGELNLGGNSATPTPGPLQIGSEGSSADALAGGSDHELDLGQVSNDEAASSLELMNDLDLKESESSVGSRSSISGDVLSELDLLSGDSGGSGLLSGESESLLGSSLMSIDSGGSSGVDDALADDDDLIIADDDDDLVVSGAGSDISIAGDSGINLMSPSDSGLSLESEPLDLAGSSVSALDLGAELSDGSSSGTGGGSAGSGLVPGDPAGSAVDFQADEEFQLSPSGIQLESTDESASQVIDIEESNSVDVDAIDFSGSGIGSSVVGSGIGSGSGSDLSNDAFEGDVAFEEADIVADAGFDDGGGLDDQGIMAGEVEEAGVDASGGFDDSPVRAVAPIGAAGGYQIPFTLLQTIGLMLILIVMSLGGMLMTDLVRNMWSYTEPAAPVSSLTDALIEVAGWGR
ncbi:MAG: helix-turn-helix domain-containing protein [Rubripirellula sp.]